MGGLDPGSPKKKMSPDRPSVTGNTGNEGMMELLLDMSSPVAQHEQGNCTQDQRDETVRMISPRPATYSMGSSREPTPRKEDAHVSKVVRKKMAHQLKQAHTPPLLTESTTEESDSEEEMPLFVSGYIAILIIVIKCHGEKNLA